MIQVKKECITHTHTHTHTYTHLVTIQSMPAAHQAQAYSCSSLVTFPYGEPAVTKAIP
jgi:hypothetical protein